MNFKTIIFLVSIYTISFYSSGQTKDWNFYDFDSIVSVEMPFDVYEVDTIINYNKVYQIFSNDSIQKFIIQRSFISKTYSNIETLKPPNDKNSLKVFYREIAWTINDLIDYELDRYFPIEKDNLMGYRFIFKNEDIDIQEIQLFLVNKNLYSFNYFSLNGLKENEIDLFFNSILFNKDISLEQYPKKPILSLKNIIILLLIVLLISFMTKSKNKLKT